MAIVYKDRSCNPTPLVHKDMAKTTTMYQVSFKSRLYVLRYD